MVNHAGETYAVAVSVKINEESIRFISRKEFIINEYDMSNKRYLLMYSLILLAPPVHELGHILIASLIGERIHHADWLCVYLENITPLDFLHDIWEWTIIIPLVCTILFAYFEIMSSPKTKSI